MNNSTVLIIDDAQDVHALLKARLGAEALQLHHAYSGEEGHRMAQHVQPNLILLDIGLRDQSGFQVCRRLKSDPLTAETPVIFLSADQEVDSKVKALDMGAVDYVTKPFEGAELRARVRAALRQKRLQDALSARTQTDTRTGLPNRGQFERRLTEEMAAVRRYGRKLSLVLVEVDEARLRDLGAAALAQQGMQLMGEWLPTQLRTSDVAFRYGEAEFVLLLPETDRKGAERVVQRLEERVTSVDLKHRGQRAPLRIRVGVAAVEQLSGAALTSQGLVVLADESKGRFVPA